MRLEPLYTVTFTTPEAWSVEVDAVAGIGGRSSVRAFERIISIAFSLESPPTSVIQ